MPNFFQERAAKERAARMLKRRFHGRPSLHAKTVPLYPITAEREFVRITNGYFRLMDETVKRYLPSIMRAYKRERRKDARFDDMQEVTAFVRQQISKMAEHLERVLYLFGLEDQIWRIATIAKNVSLREWLRAVRATFGIDLENGYYNGEFYAEILNPWVSESVRRVRSFVPETFQKMGRTIVDGIKEGLSVAAIMGAAMAVYRLSRSQARNMVRNQVGDLNSALSKLHQTDAGCQSYRWHTAGDDRVRPCHRALDGEVIPWDRPPEMWYATKKGIVHTGRYCHPGEDYNCRCTAVPIFNQETLKLPIRISRREAEERKMPWIPAPETLDSTGKF